MKVPIFLCLLTVLAFAGVVKGTCTICLDDNGFLDDSVCESGDKCVCHKPIVTTRGLHGLHGTRKGRTANKLREAHHDDEAVEIANIDKSSKQACGTIASCCYIKEETGKSAKS
jgi:hypothetical protein